MADLMIILVILVIVGGAGAYVYKAKKRGVKCIGCPDGSSCKGGCAGSCAGCSCGCASKDK